MKRIFMLTSLALMLGAAVVLPGVAQAASPKAQCRQAADQMGFGPDNYNLVIGSKKNDDFSTKGTTGNDLFCGLGGDDSIGTLDEGDVFLGGDGNDSVGTNNSADFYGDAGNDSVGANYGEFYGGAGDDSVGTNYGEFYGGVGNDSVRFNYGTFYGGPDYDSIDENYGVTDGSVENGV